MQSVKEDINSHKLEREKFELNIFELLQSTTSQMVANFKPKNEN
jgi:hypothetical protein